MRKLKKFVLNDARMLSRDELALVEGGLDISAVDQCTESTKGQACVYYISKDAAGHCTIILGTCAVTYKQVGSHVIVDSAYCY